MDSEPILQRILALLDEDGCPYESFRHDPVSSAREAAAARGTELDEGVKAIFLKYDTSFGIFALNAARELRSARIRRGLRVKRTRFATRDELSEMVGLAPGSVPPFGEPVLSFPLFADPSVFERETMIFTAGSRVRSLRMATADYRRIAKPQVVPFIR